MAVIKNSGKKEVTLIFHLFKKQYFMQKVVFLWEIVQKNKKKLNNGEYSKGLFIPFLILKEWENKKQLKSFNLWNFWIFYEIFFKNIFELWK